MHTVIPADPITANPDGPFNLLLAPAERADVIIDFNGLAGKIVHPVQRRPGALPRGRPPERLFHRRPAIQTASGGAPTTLAGYGPNTRTIMKIVVGLGPEDPMRQPDTIGKSPAG